MSTDDSSESEVGRLMKQLEAADGTITTFEGRIKLLENQLATVNRERDDAQKACAEMREAILAYGDGLVDYEVFNALGGRPTAKLKHAGQLAKHALSTDCGKGFVPVSELEAANRDVRLMKEQVKVSDEAFNFHMLRANLLAGELEQCNELLNEFAEQVLHARKRWSKTIRKPS